MTEPSSGGLIVGPEKYASPDQTLIDVTLEYKLPIPDIPYSNFVVSVAMRNLDPALGEPEELAEECMEFAARVLRTGEALLSNEMTALVGEVSGIPELGNRLVNIEAVLKVHDEKIGKAGGAIRKLIDAMAAKPIEDPE